MKNFGQKPIENLWVLRSGSPSLEPLIGFLSDCSERKPYTGRAIRAIWGVIEA
jgi:hypothetical protein